MLLFHYGPTALIFMTFTILPRGLHILRSFFYYFSSPLPPPPPPNTHFNALPPLTTLYIPHALFSRHYRTISSPLSFSLSLSLFLSVSVCSAYKCWSRPPPLPPTAGTLGARRRNTAACGRGNGGNGCRKYGYPTAGRGFGSAPTTRRRRPRGRSTPPSSASEAAARISTSPTRRRISRAGSLYLGRRFSLRRRDSRMMSCLRSRSRICTSTTTTTATRRRLPCRSI